MSTDTSDLSRLPALALAELVRKRKVSSEELVKGCLDRIALHDAELSAFVQITGAAALREARRKDRELRAADARDLPPFFGVPTAVKDLQFARGTFTRLGSRAFRWLWSPVDDAIVTRMRAGGFVILGKLSTSELGALPVTEPLIHPPTRNPWNHAYTPGGSSGGTGAALAARLLPIAQGSDGAGSIRIPSSFCHLFGIKPSRGCLKPGYGKESPQSLSSCGPMGHSVDDVAAALDVMAGASSGGAPSFHELSREKPPRLRIKVALVSPLVSATPEVAAAVKRVAALLESLGHHVEESGFADGSVEEFLPLWQWGVSRAPVIRTSSLGSVARWLVEAGRKLDERAVMERHDLLERRIAGWFAEGDVDLCVTPTVAEPPPRIGVWSSMPPDEAFASAARVGAFTAPFNITGQPAASVPAGLGSTGLPIGVQIAGRRGDDGRLLAVCRQLEEAMPWAHRQAPGV